MGKISWSIPQQTVIEAYENTRDHLVCLSTAGSGKTTLLLELLRRTSRTKRVLFLAFNRSIAQELKDRVPQGVEASTIHSLGLRALRYRFGKRVRIDQKGKAIQGIVIRVVDAAFPDMVQREFKKRWRMVASLQSAVEQYRLNACQSIEDLYGVIERNAIEIGPNALNLFPAIWDKVQDMHDSYFTDPKTIVNVDFIDMIYLFATRDQLTIRPYDIVMLDEAQDANVVMQKIVFKSMKQGGRFVVVGDTYQSIYGFMGSDPQSIDNFKAYDDGNREVREVTLPITYRCAKEVVKEAQQYYPEMEAFENNKEGVVEHRSIDEAEPGDFVLCRTNAPLFEAYIQFLKKGKKAQIKDRTLEKRLMRILEDCDAFSISGLMEYLGRRRHEIVEELLSERNLLPMRIANHPQVVSWDEYTAIFVALSNVSDDVESMKHRLRTIFEDSHMPTIQLMSMHKSKGLEATNVYIIRPDLVPHPNSKTSAQRIQEQNLHFVAITRAKLGLYYDTVFGVKDE